MFAGIILTKHETIISWNKKTMGNVFKYSKKTESFDQFRTTRHKISWLVITIQ